MTDPTLDEMLEIAKQKEEEHKQLQDDFFVYYVIDYMATGEGRTIYLFVERNYENENVLESIRRNVEPFYFDFIQRVSEEDFFKYYSNLIPAQLKATIESKNIPMLSFQQMYHFNFS